MRADAIISVGCPPPLGAKCVSKPFTDQDQVQIVFFCFVFFKQPVLLWLHAVYARSDITVTVSYVVKILAHSASLSSRIPTSSNPLIAILYLSTRCLQTFPPDDIIHLLTCCHQSLTT